MLEPAKKECIEKLRKETRLPVMECRNIAERYQYDFDKTLHAIRNPTPYVGRLFSDKYVVLSTFNISIGDHGTPITQEVLDDSLVQQQIQSGLLRLKPYEDEVEEEPENTEETAEIVCPHCSGKFSILMSTGAG